jgi:pimeloyl-ACP methyl ester carboxylesterase
MKTALLIHGWPCYFEDKDEIIRSFQKLGYKVIAPKLFLDEYNIQKIISEIDIFLDKDPDVILGFSLGGIIAQIISEKYPKSKLILVATGPYLKPSSSKLFKFFINSKASDAAFFIVKILPVPASVLFYRITNLFTGSDYKTYKEDMKKNILSIKKIKFKTYKKIFDFLLDVDTSDILPKLKNHTLIISGKKDFAMPLELSILLHKNIKNSTLKKYDSAHYQILNKKTIKEIEIFVKS